jgi:hypothetical protein
MVETSLSSSEPPFSEEIHVPCQLHHVAEESANQFLLGRLADDAAEVEQIVGAQLGKTLLIVDRLAFRAIGGRTAGESAIAPAAMESRPPRAHLRSFQAACGAHRLITILRPGAKVAAHGAL